MLLSGSRGQRQWTYLPSEKKTWEERVTRRTHANRSGRRGLEGGCHQGSGFLDLRVHAVSIALLKVFY